MQKSSILVGSSVTCILVFCLGAADDKKQKTEHEDSPYNFKRARTLEDSKAITEFAFSPNGRLLAGAINDQDASTGQIGFWDPASGKKIGGSFPNQKLGQQRASIISNLAFLDDKTVAAGFGTSVVRMWSYPDGKELPPLDFKRKVERWAIAPGLIAVATCDEGPAVMLASGPPWKLQWSTNYNETPGKPFLPISIALSHDRTRVAVATGASKSNVGIFDVKGGKPIGTVDYATSELMRPWIASSPTARDLAVVSGRMRVEKGWYGSIQIWNQDMTVRKAEAGWGDINDSSESASCACGCLFTPDGKVVVVPCEDGKVRLFEENTGGFRLTARVPNSESLALSPDGSLLATPSMHGITLFDWRDHTSEKVERLDARQLSRLWDDLASRNSSIAYKSMLALESSPTIAVQMLNEKLKPLEVIQAEIIRKLIVNLGSDDFQTREEATKELEALGEAVEQELLEATQSDMPEIRERARGLLQELRKRTFQLRGLRAVEVLEHINTSESRELLKRLASGAAGARLTLDAKTSLERLVAMKHKP